MDNPKESHKMRPEIWKHHPVWQKLLVSTYGNVYALARRVRNTRRPMERLVPFMGKDDLRRVVWYNESGQKYRFLVGVLVLETWIGPRPPNTVCRHGELGLSDDRLANVIWGRAGIKQQTITEFAEAAATHIYQNAGDYLNLSTGDTFGDVGDFDGNPSADNRKTD
jgi:hypothetical protein